eukprot:gene20925-biopygen5621
MQLVVPHILPQSRHANLEKSLRSPLARSGWPRGFTEDVPRTRSGRTSATAWEQNVALSRKGTVSFGNL